MTRMYLARARRRLKELLGGAVVWAGLVGMALGVAHASTADAPWPDEPAGGGAGPDQSGAQLRLADVRSAPMKLRGSPVTLLAVGRPDQRGSRNNEDQELSL